MKTPWTNLITTWNAVNQAAGTITANIPDPKTLAPKSLSAPTLAATLLAAKGDTKVPHMNAWRKTASVLSVLVIGIC